MPLPCSSSGRSPHATHAEVVAGLVLQGLGIGLAFASLANLIVEAVPQEQTGAATAINTIMRTVGGAFGASIPASILAAHTIAGTAVPSEHAFTVVFWVTAAAMGESRRGAPHAPRPFALRDRCGTLTPMPRPTFHRILVAVEGSRHADLALSVAIALAERDHARLTILTVIPNVTESAAMAYGAGVDPVAMQADADRAAEKTIRAALEEVPDDQPVETVQRRGHAGPEILAQAKAGDHDIVILGARGLGRIGSMFGSVSQHVLHHAKSAVFVAHLPEDAVAEAEGDAATTAG